MFYINDDKSIYVTRGDVVFFAVKARDIDTDQIVEFEPGDIVRMKVYGKKNAQNVVLSKDFAVTETTDFVTIMLEGHETKIGDVISKPVDYWYEVELNPDTYPQTIVGYDDDGARLFKLFPEGADAEHDEEITPEDIPIVDAELDVNSARPIQNQAVARAVIALEGKTEVGVVHLNNGKIDKSFYQILSWCNKGIPVMLVPPDGKPPVFAVVWDDDHVLFRGGVEKMGSGTSGSTKYVSVRFMRYKVLADSTVEDTSETYGLLHT